MNQTGQSFSSSATTSRLDTGGAQIRNITTTAEARQQAIKETLLRKKAEMEALSRAAADNELKLQKQQDEAAEAGTGPLFRNT